MKCSLIAKVAVFASVSCLPQVPALAQHADHAGGKEKLGTVRFEVSCAAEVQPKFNRAMALYHSFHWNGATEAFKELAQLDPKCGMAYWGLAMVAADNPFTWPGSLNLKLGPQLIAKAKELGAGTQRERDYIEALSLLYEDHAGTPHRARALRYEEAMGKLAARHPGDIEATILYGLAVSANHDLNDRAYERPLKAVSLLEPLFRAHPDHPGVAHYVIHSYDYPPIAHKGIEAAQRYAKIAADAPHAQHMPSHIFTRVGYWRESIAANQASIAVSKGNVRSNAHARDYMVYAYLQLADDAAAEAVWADTLKVGALKGVAQTESFAFAAMPARLALERGRWADAAKVEPHSGIADADWQRLPQSLANVVFARALGAARSGDGSATRAEIARLRQLQALLTERKISYWAQQVDIQANISTAWALRAEGKNDEAIAAMRAAADQEDKTEKNVVTPGPLLPARELLGDMLMELGQAGAALKEYEASLAKEPNRFRGLYGAALAAERSGDRARARAHYEKLAAMTAQSKSERAELKRVRQVLAQR
jgi:tetratricopeptide (TPR) repeat protein